MNRVIVLATLLLAACGSSEQTVASAPTTRTTQVTTAGDSPVLLEQSSAAAGFVPVIASPDALWQVLPAVYAELGLQGRVIDAQRMVFGQPETTVRRQLAGTQLSRYLDCGRRVGVVNANSYNVTLTVTSYVRPHGEGAAQLRTQVDATARAPGTSEAAVRCGTTNELERQIERLARERLESAG